MLSKIEFGKMVRRASDKQLVYVVGAARNVDKPKDNEVIIFAPIGENGFMVETCVQSKEEFLHVFEKV